MSDASAGSTTAPVVHRSSTPSELSIIVPCHNEAENVLELAERVRATFEPHGIECELVLVNDASTDHTGALIDDLSRRYAFVRAVHHPVNRGMTAGWESGLHASSGRYVVIMDGDLQNLPEDVYRLYRELIHTNADIVQGHRSHIGRARDFRYTMSRVLHCMLRVLFAISLSDIKCGFLICEREIFAHILRHRFSYSYFQTFIVVSAHHKGYRIEEIETLFEERILGESFISALPMKMIFKNLVDLAKGFVEFRLLPLHTDTLSEYLERHRPVREPDSLPLWRRLWLRLFTLLMPLHHWKLSPTALRYYEQLRRSQWLAPERIRELQERRLRALIKHTHRHSAYYRERFKRLGIEPDAIQRLGDLHQMPVLTRDDIRRNLHFELLSDSHDKLRMLPVSSCGATDEPLTLYADKAQLEMRWATTLRNLEWTGYRFGDRYLRLLPWKSAVSRLQVFREWLDAALSRRIDAYGVAGDDAHLRRLLRRLHGRAPALLEGSAEMLLLAARAAGNGNLAARVVSSEQTLTADDRRLIEESLASELFDQYRSRELSSIAQQCEQHRGYHVNAESYIVEIVRDGRQARPGEVGEVLVTDLNNLSVPLIRYAIGDRAIATDDTCPCGRGLPLIGSIAGRPAVLLKGTKGDDVPAGIFAEVLKDYGHIVRRFRVEQQRPGIIVLRIIKGPRFSDATLRPILEIFHRRLGSSITIDVQLVDRIEPPAEVGP